MSTATYARTTIALKAKTKKRLDACRAPGQCYNGFISQLVDLWSEQKQGKNPRGQVRAAEQ